MKQKKFGRILIVDDSEDNHTLLRTFFEAHGIACYSAYDGREAMSLLHELSELPQIILLDSQMPRMSGTEFRRAQMAVPRFRHIPVIVVSAETEIPHAADLVEPLQIFVKPLDIDLMIAEVVSLLEQTNISDMSTKSNATAYRSL